MEMSLRRTIMSPPLHLFRCTLITRHQQMVLNSLNLNYQFYQKYSATSPPQRPPTFLGKIVENIREEFQRSQKMKESLREFRKDMEELERSEALQKAREKYKTVEEETIEGTKKLRKQIDHLTKQVKESVEDAQKTEFVQRASRVGEELGRHAQKVGQTISQKSEDFSKSQTYKTLSSTARAVREEIDRTTFGKGSRVYQPPKVLLRRTDRDPLKEAMVIRANTEARGIVLHKDSKFSQSWQTFRENNPYINRVLEWKTKLDESDNPVVRASMLLRDKVSEMFGGVFQKTELSEALTEICKADPEFDKERFLLECEYFIIPNILEAMVRPDLEVLRDWCYERAYSVLSHPVKQAQSLGFHFDSKVLDVDNVDLVMGKVMEEGPVLAISFKSQQILCVKNSKNEVVEGDPNKVLAVQYVWVLCREQLELQPQTAWRLLDLSAQSSEQLI